MGWMAMDQTRHGLAKLCKVSGRGLWSNEPGCDAWPTIFRKNMTTIACGPAGESTWNSFGYSRRLCNFGVASGRTAGPYGFPIRPLARKFLSLKLGSRQHRNSVTEVRRRLAGLCHGESGVGLRRGERRRTPQIRMESADPGNCEWID